MSKLKNRTITRAFFILISLFIISCNHKEYKVDHNSFKAPKVSQTTTISIDGKMENVFPLFGAFEERKWAKGWDPVLIYPETGTIVESTTFKTQGHGHDESQFIWRVSKYEPDEFLIQYFVTTENRYWTITVQCEAIDNIKTSA